MSESELDKAYKRLHEAYRSFARYNGIDIGRVITAVNDMDDASEDILYITNHGEEDWLENRK